MLCGHWCWVWADGWNIVGQRGRSDGADPMTTVSLQKERMRESSDRDNTMIA